uniref:NADH-ubiquinone oxidoreductase chain 1 n=1 Tax=Baicaloclepsis grubei TaxID=1592345 RepID=A0A9E8K0Y9_9ANNE|nr:NADH dehydrogenase subunit 1 [Baicaloclepsis grubei]UZT67834.1 NADH dehydrogenase subunit 1 [Baicaloclepsis grubei]
MYINIYPGPIVTIIISMLMALMAMAFFTLMERKLLGYFQTRKGPNKVMFMGLPQPLSDAMKLFLKEQMIQYNANKSLFIIAPMLSLLLALMLWSIYPHQNTTFWIQYGILYFLCVSAMNVYATFIAGWSSNSKYALLGAFRGVAQTISYEISMSMILLSALMLTMTMDISIITNYLESMLLFMLMPITFLWFISTLAETNRSPFDFAEGESELVSGFNVEYGSSMFALIFMAEYMNILFMSTLTAAIFITSIFKYLSMFQIMVTMMLATLFVWIRASYPRMRYDCLMMLTWKTFLPFSISMLIILLPLCYLIQMPINMYTNNIYSMDSMILFIFKYMTNISL